MNSNQKSPLLGRGRHSSLQTLLTGVGMAVPMMTVTAYAQADIFAGFKGMFSSIYNGLFGMVNVVAAICLVIAVIKMITASESREAAEAKKWVKTIVIALVGINLLGWLFTTISQLTAGWQYTVT